jgi:uncharacterized protein (DUF58 family)
VPIRLGAAMEVAPRPSPVALDDLQDAGAGAGEASAPGGPGHDIVRGVRPYTPGDPIRIVHWPASARWGQVMVKELDVNVESSVVIVVDLRGDPDAAEAAASTAAGVAGAALAAGHTVSLLTAEKGGPCAGSVDSPRQAGRRLARAVGDAAPPPPPAGASVVRVTAG